MAPLIFHLFLHWPLPHHRSTEWAAHVSSYYSWQHTFPALEIETTINCIPLTTIKHGIVLYLFDPVPGSTTGCNNLYIFQVESVSSTDIIKSNATPKMASFCSLVTRSKRSNRSLVLDGPKCRGAGKSSRFHAQQFIHQLATNLHLKPNLCKNLPSA